VQDGDRHVGKTLADACFELRRQIDFRHEQQRLPAFFQGRGNEAQIDLGLAAAGDAIQQKRRVSRAGRHGGDGSGLLGIQRRQGRRRAARDGERPRPPRLGLRFAQAGRQRLEHGFAQGGLVILAGEFAQPEKILGQGRQVVQHGVRRLQLRLCHFALCGQLDDDADPLAAPERHANAQAARRREFRRAAVIEQAVERQVERDAHDQGVRRRARGAAVARRFGRPTCRQILQSFLGYWRKHVWRKEVFHLSPKVVDNFVDRP
jgi:hypothetical protein